MGFFTRVQHKLHNFLAIKLSCTISLNTIQTTWCLVQLVFVAACPPAILRREVWLAGLHVWIQYSMAVCARNAHITVYDVTTWSWVNLVNPRQSKLHAFVQTFCPHAYEIDRSRGIITRKLSDDRTLSRALWGWWEWRVGEQSLLIFLSGLSVLSMHHYAGQLFNNSRLPEVFNGVS